MREATKVRDVSVKYNISARALKYYEDMGLLQSEKGNGYAYRMFDSANIRRLEQILILRRLRVSIKDIRRILSAPGSEVVLDVLGKKVDDIDEEVSLLHELKEIVLTFIRQIERADFSKESDVKLLYDKAKEIETQVAHAEYTGNPSPVHRLFDVTRKLDKKAAAGLLIPENVLSRMLRNVYFIWGSNEGIAVADELGRRYGLFVYHTCEHRHAHSRNADPQHQPGLCRFQEDIPDFWAQDPEEAMRWEQEIVHDFTPMVIMDLIALTAKHEKVICENDIDIGGIIRFVTHAVRISNDRTAGDFCGRYENEIRGRDISDDEKDRLIRTVGPAFEKVKGEIPGESTRYGVKQIHWDGRSTIEQTADEVAAFFGLSPGNGRGA